MIHEMVKNIIICYILYHGSTAICQYEDNIISLNIIDLIGIIT